MSDRDWKKEVSSFDRRRNIAIPGDSEETVDFCVLQFLQIAQQAIQKNGVFSVALSGGQTPHAIFKALSQPLYRQAIDWSKMLCFWSDERNVPPNHPDSNYFNAMQAGLSALPLLPENIFRMPTEGDLEEQARSYESLIREKVPSLRFDLIMLGMGEDGHTASLFPFTSGLHIKNRLVISNYVPQKKSWRLSMTYSCIHRAKHICLYVMGSNKARMVAAALRGPYDPERLPVQRIGTTTRKALWILDTAAGKDLHECLGD